MISAGLLVLGTQIGLALLGLLDKREESSEYLKSFTNIQDSNAVYY